MSDLRPSHPGLNRPKPPKRPSGSPTSGKVVYGRVYHEGRSDTPEAYSDSTEPLESPGYRKPSDMSTMGGREGPSADRFDHIRRGLTEGSTLADRQKAYRDAEFAKYLQEPTTQLTERERSVLSTFGRVLSDPPRDRHTN
jgi:hypothetical protein